MAAQTSMSVLPSALKRSCISVACWYLLYSGT